MTSANVFVLTHVYKTRDEEYERKLLGSYSSHAKALEAAQRYRELPGFRQHPESFKIFEAMLDQDAAWTEGFFTVNPHTALIYKIVPRTEWEAESGDYHGSAHDKADGFLHFSTAAQLPETLRRYYAGQDDLTLVAVDAGALGAALKWEYSQSRDEDFPHLHGSLSPDAIKWARPIAKGSDGDFMLPELP
jgi:uncharacterized protein (DUF952 family)